MEFKSEDSPPRPLVPPKPDKISFISTSPATGSTTTNNIGIAVSCGNSFSFSEIRKPSQNGHNQRPPPIAPKPFSSISPNKPALPPKPSNSSSSRLSTTSPPSNLTTPENCGSPFTPKISPPLLPKGRNSLSIANAILASRNNSIDKNANTRPPPNRKPSEDSSFNATRRDVRCPSAPISPRPLPPPISPRPASSVFTFPFTTESNQSKQNSNISPLSPSLKGKSLSLGRNVVPPTSPTSSVSQFFSSKAATLARMLPLDLSFKKSSQSSSPVNKSKTSVSLPPTINSSSHNNNRVSFFNNSAIPPPPPPRHKLKNKLSPVNSISPVDSTTPTSPPPVFSPTPVTTPDDFATYAVVDKDKKWADRRQKEGFSSVKVDATMNKANDEESAEDEIQVSLVITINRDNDPKTVNVQSMTIQENNEVPKSKECETQTQNKLKTSQAPSLSSTINANNNNLNNGKSAESRIVDSWLGNYLKTPVHNVEDQNQIFLSSDPELNGNDAEISSNLIEVDKLNTNDADLPPLIENKSFLFSRLSTVGSKEDESEKDASSSMTTTLLQEQKVMLTSDPVESEAEIVPPLNNPDFLLHSVDDKIQSAVNRLSNLSGKSSPSQQPGDTPPPPPLLEELEYLSITENNNSKDVCETLVSSILTATTSSIIRRRSWNCSGDSSSVSSSLSDLKSLPHKENLGWVDEGDSTGALGDIDTSDAQVPNSSTEDCSTGSSFSKRKKNSGVWFFSSARKSSSTSSSETQKTPKKQKSKSSVVTDTNANGKLVKGRNSLSAVTISKPVISSPVSNFPPPPPKNEELEKMREKSYSHPTVQFSPEVLDSPVSSSSLYPRHRYSEGSIGESSLNFSIPPPESEKGDNESICSFSSVSTTGTGYNLNGSGYEDILAELSPPEKKAFYVAREILTSEQTFVDVLNLLTVDFPNAIRSVEDCYKHPIISHHEFNEILNNLPHLKLVNIELADDLQCRILNWRENPKLADVIIAKGPFLKVYSEYIKSYPKTTQKLMECCNVNPVFKKAVKDFEMSDRCQKLGLTHYMLKPVQRMPQYRLLLEDYLKNLEETGCDYNDTVKALAIVKDVAEHADGAIRLQVNTEKLLSIQNRLVGAIIMKADRQLLKEGELTKVCRKDTQPRFFALMNDVLFYMTYNVGATTSSTKDLKLRNELPLVGMRVEISDTGDFQNEFSVISTARSFNLVAKSARDREDWMKALNAAIQDNIRKRSCRTPDQLEGLQLGKIAPVWIQDSRVTMCQICTAEFRLTFRRHHCRSCGKVVCGNCSGNQSPLQYLKNDAARVCDECYQHLLEEFDRESRESTNDGLEISRDTIRNRFKKVTPNVTKSAGTLKRHVPSRLEVHANNAGCRISSYLHLKERKAWKRQWFVLMDRVLYIYAAPEDIVAIRSIPVLGWNVEEEESESMDGGDSEAVFKLTHLGQNTLLFQADKQTLSERWVSAMKEATVLS